MITEEQVEKAVDYLRDSAESCAKARAERLYLDDFSRSLKAQIQAEYSSEPLGAQERHAYSDARYLAHLEGLKQAIYEDERGRFLREAALAKLEAFRTFSANTRGA